MVTWFDYVLKKAVTYPALQETCVCTLHHGDTNFHDITVHYVGEYEGKAIVAISKLNPLFNTLSELFNPVVMIDLEALFPLDFGLIQTHWRPLLSCPENESVSFQRIDGTMFSGYRRNDNSIFALSQVEWDGTPSFYIGVSDVCTHRMSELDIPVWCKDADSALTAMNFINNYQQPKTEPKRWTVEDQKAGRLPEVGVLVEYFANNDHFDTEITGQWRNGDELEILRGQNKNKAFVVFNKRTEQISNLIINCMKPIETPDEKAQRLRDEWRIKALSSASILSGMQEYELKRLGGYIGDIYDALLSGELTMPSKDGE